MDSADAGATPHLVSSFVKVTRLRVRCRHAGAGQMMDSGNKNDNEKPRRA
jgi:hypothetical protein